MRVQSRRSVRDSVSRVVTPRWFTCLPARRHIDLSERKRIAPFEVVGVCKNGGRDVCGGTGEQIKHDIADKCQKQNLDLLTRAHVCMVCCGEGCASRALGISHKFQRTRISRPVYYYWKYRLVDVFTRSISVSKRCICILYVHIAGGAYRETLDREKFFRFRRHMINETSTAKTHD